MVTLIGPGIFPGAALLAKLESKANLTDCGYVAVSPGKSQWMIPEERVDDIVRLLHAQTIPG